MIYGIILNSICIIINELRKNPEKKKNAKKVRAKIAIEQIGGIWAYRKV
jgi:hypothetical protein